MAGDHERLGSELLGIAAIASVRYALWNRTVIVSEVCQFVGKVAPYLYPEDVKQIIADIRDQRSGGYGGRVDRASWMKLIHYLQARYWRPTPLD